MNGEVRVRRVVQSLKRFIRYAGIYGLIRVVFKAAGRMRRGRARWFCLNTRSGPKDIAVIGCGQFAFATLGYVIATRLGIRFRRCYDVNAAAMESFSRFYDVPEYTESPETIFQDPEIKLVYVASNHASHTSFAIKALESGKSVYVEKPVSVSLEQLRELSLAVRRYNVPIYAGYNRPFSAAMERLRDECKDVAGPLSLSCFVVGHQIPLNHWYRDPQEGTRICGNIGHWIDLAVHMMSWRKLPDRLAVRLIASSPESRSENMTLSLVSDSEDLVSITFVTRTEPYEGVNETINVQWGDVIAKIDDFREMTVWRDDRLSRHRYWPKDVGHVNAIIQPFNNKTQRDWREVELSTLLTLHVADMSTQGISESFFSFTESWQDVLGTKNTHRSSVIDDVSAAVA